MPPDAPIVWSHGPEAPLGVARYDGSGAAARTPVPQDPARQQPATSSAGERSGTTSASRQDVAPVPETAEQATQEVPTASLGPYAAPPMQYSHASADSGYPAGQEYTPQPGSPADTLRSFREGDYASGWLERPSPEQEASLQAHLEEDFPLDRRGGHQRFPDPRGFTYGLAGPVRSLNRRQPRNSILTDLGSASWVQRINGRQPRSGARRTSGRLVNCVEASRAFIATWHGRPTVAAAVLRPDDPESRSTGNDRTAQWLNARWRTHHTSAAEVYRSLADRLLDNGHGSSAIIAFRHQNGNAHEYNAVNYQGQIFWVDAQLGRVSARPLYPPAISS
ncbi:toxin glutamine deamidase domain-containing protein [Actinacidiphila sp. DG2A-62]|uniref:toxin glutamine deamidase domain-containing protein n=1 Tax=Actinacidiphila sp. DG2A-62 TaxID=3108821 RepID=UPI002DB9809C|nr:toxin glutamine deamidase domain-containing protein [Actinacidiphila sp. DG2A-62]MEC3993784.1 toxin glutamine deamidase domain-containing protein [Actinacidiphila sp. DG2A-62]